jgi:hypothetical protein
MYSFYGRLKVPHGRFRLSSLEKNLRPPEIEPRFSDPPARIPVGMLGELYGCESQTYSTLWEISIEIIKPIMRPTWEPFITRIGASMI